MTKRWTLLTLLLVAPALLVSCRHSSDGTSSEESASQKGETKPSEAFGTVDSVKTHSDPKGGWFSAKLRDVYREGEDKPVVYCDSGPSIPTGKPVTIFYVEAKSKPDSSACRKVLGVVDGEGVWKDGKALTMAELDKIKDREEHFKDLMVSSGSIGDPMPPAWRNAKPIGEPCPDLSGSMDAVTKRYKGKECSLAIVTDFPGAQFFFLNWKITGHTDLDMTNRNNVMPNAVAAKIASEYGSKYVVTYRYHPA